MRSINGYFAMAGVAAMGVVFLSGVMRGVGEGLLGFVATFFEAPRFFVVAGLCLVVVLMGFFCDGWPWVIGVVVCPVVFIGLLLWGWRVFTGGGLIAACKRRLTILPYSASQAYC
jgi:protein-S-isoprenylcysteine O-methyltransferase Ste14